MNRNAARVVENLVREGIAAYVHVPGVDLPLPATSNIETAESVVVACSGYPEHAGVWSYTLLDKSAGDPVWLDKTTMEPYFRDLHDTDTALIVLNPHAQELKQIPDASIGIYLSQLQHLFDHLASARGDGMRSVLLGFSLGGEVVLRFLHSHPYHIRFARGLVLIDPVPPSIRRPVMSPELSALVDQASFYGFGDLEGNPGELVEYTKKILQITPELVSCRYHGEMPNLVWPRIRQRLPALLR
ncbi:MAG: hypothetical protein AB1558_14575 [Thermodesulfobacteriota bacterium]